MAQGCKVENYKYYSSTIESAVVEIGHGAKACRLGWYWSRTNSYVVGTVLTFYPGDPYGELSLEYSGGWYYKFNQKGTIGTFQYTNIIFQTDSGVQSTGGGGVADAETTVTVSATPKTGYVIATLNGYDIADKTTGTQVAQVAIPSLPADDTHVYVTTSPYYSIAFNANGGTGAPATVSPCLVGVEYQIPSNTPTRSGYKFLGWSTTSARADAGLIDYAPDDNFTRSAAITAGQTIYLYASWKQYTLTYDAAGGTPTPTSQTYYGNVTLASAPSKSGLTFGGWLIGGVTYAAGSTYNLTEDATAVAQWSNCSVTVSKSASAGLLSLVRVSDGSVVATESDGVLSFVGAAGTYRVACALGDEKPDVLYVATGIAGLTDNTIQATDGSVLSYEFVLTPKSLYEIRLAASADGSLAVTSPAEPDYDDSGTAKYAAGRNVVVTATPNAGRELQKFIIENLATHESSERTQFENNQLVLSNVNADYLVTAVYELIDYSLSATVDSPSVGALTVEVSAGSAHYGDTVTFTATPASGYSFEGWYLDGEKVDGAGAEYSPTVVSDLALVAKAKVAVALDIDAETGTSASLTVNGAAYVPQTPVDVTLGDSLSFALSIATGYFDAWYSVVDGSRVLTPYDSSETITPTANTSLVAVVAADAPQRSATFDIKNDEGGASVSAAAGDVTLLPAPDLSSVVDGKLVFTYTGTKKVRVTCAASIEGRGLSEPIAFTKATLNDVDYSENREFDLVVNGAIELTLWYGSTGSRTVTIGYTDGSDMTMGEILADGGTDPVTKPRGQKVAIFAAPKNGYTFIGWFSTPTAQGDPLFDGEPSFEIVVSTNVTLYARFAQNDHSICEWEGSKTPKALVWRSKTYAASKPFNPSACRVDGLGYPPGYVPGTNIPKVLELTVDMFSAPDVNAKPTASTTLTNIANQNARRLPVRRMERYMQVQIKANVEIDTLLVGTSMEGIAL